MKRDFIREQAWLIELASEGNPMTLYFAATDNDGYWTSNRNDARRFSSEHIATEYRLLKVRSSDDPFNKAKVQFHTWTVSPPSARGGGFDR